MEEQGKKLNMFNKFCLGLGGAIGSGIFVLLGYGIAYTGRCGMAGRTYVPRPLCNPIERCAPAQQG